MTTSAHTPSSPAGFDRWQLPAHVAQAVWRGTEVGAAAGRALPTGFEVLDAALPGGGWPTQGLSEVLLAQAALCMLSTTVVSGVGKADQRCWISSKGCSASISGPS